MEAVVLKAKYRDVIGKQVKALRRDGLLPAVLYGHRINPIPVSLDYRDVSKMLSQITSSQLVIVDVDGEQHHTLVRDKQRDPVLSTIMHVDFLVVSMTEKLRAEVILDLVGDAPAVKDFSGILLTGLESIEVECLPQDLLEKITVDLSSLKEIGDTIFVKDISLPESVEVLTDPEEIIASVTFAALEEEEEIEEEAEEEPEVIEKGRKEEDQEDSE